MTPQQLTHYRNLRGWPYYFSAHFAWEQAKTAWFVTCRDFYMRVKL